MSARHALVATPATQPGTVGAFFQIWGRVPLVCAFAVIMVSTLTLPEQSGSEVPALVGNARTVTTPVGAVDIEPTKVYSTGALIEVNATLSATPDDLLANPDQVLAPAPGRDHYALTLRTRTSASAPTTREVDAAPGNRPHSWRLAFWLPRTAWSDNAPRLVWPVAHLDIPLDLHAVELIRATHVVRLRDR